MSEHENKMSDEAAEKLARFGARLLDIYTDHWDYGDLDGSEVNDVALETGVIVQRLARHQPGDCEACDEFDTPCCGVPPEVQRAMAAIEKL